MNFNKKNNSDPQNNALHEDDTSHEDGNILHDIDAMYLSVENQRIKDAILKPDTDTFYLFTRMLRISSMLKNAKVTHKIHKISHGYSG